MKVFRTCKKCKTKFDIMSEEYLKTRNQGGYIHQKCYVELQLKKGISHDAIQESIEILKEAMLVEQKERDRVQRENNKKKLLAKQTQVNRKRDREEFLKYVSEKYGVATFPRYFFTKVASINNGTHPNVRHAIPYDDLLDMFKQGEKNLSQIKMRQMTRNKELSGLDALNYDLSVLVNRYDGYLAWKQKQKMLEENEVETIQVETNTVGFAIRDRKTETESEDYVLDIIDEFY